VFRMTVRATDPGKARARVSAIEVALDNFLDDRSEIPIFLLEPALVLRQEALKIMEQHPVENRALRMARAIDSRHIRNADSKSVPGTREGRSGGTRKNLSTIGDARGKKEGAPSALFGLGHGANLVAVLEVDKPDTLRSPSAIQRRA
jgi:hypothetical protein